VLTQEVVILLGALGALGLGVLGTLELMWPSRRRRKRRTPEAEATAPSAARPAARARRWRSRYPRHAAGGPDRYLKRPQRVDTPAVELSPIAMVDAEAAAIEPPAESAVERLAESAAEPPVESTIAPVADAVTEPFAESGAALPAGSAGTIVDRCVELYEAGRYSDAASVATAALADDASAAARPADDHEAAALWSLLGLAQQALGDHAVARAALETAIERAPAGERAAYERQLATLALDAARELVEAAGAHVASESEARVADLRHALLWLERGLAVAPDDAELRELTTTGQTRLWAAYEQVVMALVQRQDFHAARRLLHEALEDPRVPAARAFTFRELFSGTFSGEIGALTAQAIRSMQEARETEALTALERAERLLADVHEEALPPRRREEVDRRLWWGYNRLGRRRVDAGAFEEAIDPLVRALRLAGPSPERQSETRAALVQAFEGWTDTRALAIREAADAGDREAALVGTDRVWTRLRDALEEGLSERDLAAAFARVRALFEEIGGRP